MSDHALALIAVGDVITLEDGRKVQVQGTEYLTVIVDRRDRIAVRNVETRRLSYIPRWRLENAATTMLAKARNDFNS